MNAIEMLKQQHREVDALFEEFEAETSAGARLEIFERIADALAIHAAIEERHFYPEVKARETEEILAESVEEHLQVKRAIADIMKLETVDEAFEAKVKVLKEDVQRHVKEEENELFPEVADLFDGDMLETIGAEMEQTQGELLAEGNPRDAVPDEIETAAPL
jgi:hemerythrin superfamily protein